MEIKKEGMSRGRMGLTLTVGVPTGDGVAIAGAAGELVPC